MHVPVGHVPAPAVELMTGPGAITAAELTTPSPGGSVTGSRGCRAPVAPPGVLMATVGAGTIGGGALALGRVLRVGGAGAPGLKASWIARSTEPVRPRMEDCIASCMVLVISCVKATTAGAPAMGTGSRVVDAAEDAGVAAAEAGTPAPASVEAMGLSAMSCKQNLLSGREAARTTSELLSK